MCETKGVAWPRTHLNEDDVCCFYSYIRPSAYGDADISLSQSRGVIDPVTHHSHLHTHTYTHTGRGEPVRATVRLLNSHIHPFGNTDQSTRLLICMICSVSKECLSGMHLYYHQ